MLISINLLSGESQSAILIGKQIIGGSLIVGIIIWVLIKKEIKIPFEDHIKKDHEMQVFIAFAFCFGFSILTALFGLSSALGAFIAGILVAAAKATTWVRHSLHAFRIIFVALFFVSVGMLIDLKFLQTNFTTIFILVILVFITNNFINTIIVRFLGEKWSDSFYTGSILAQIGEFSFILGASAYLIGLITEYTYQLIISTISITLIFGPIWIALIVKLITLIKKVKQ